jgi:hypothetical protein
MTVSALIIITAISLFLLSQYTKEYNEDTRKYMSKRRRGNRTYKR